MIYISKRTIILITVIITVILTIIFFAIRNNYCDTEDTFADLEKKTVILDAGHGYPDERGSWN